MAAPAVTGVVALMRERHPDWTPAQIRSALIGSAVPAYADSNATVEASPLRTGGGFVDAARRRRAGHPLRAAGARLRAAAAGCVGERARERDRHAGDGAGAWQVSIDRHGGSPAGATAGAPAELVVPPGGAVLLPVTLTVAPDTVEGDAAGYVVLTQGTRSRRIPYWAHVERPRFATATSYLLHPGIVRGLDARAARPRRALPLPGVHRRARPPRALAGRRDALPLPPQPARDQRRRDRRVARRRRPAAVRAARARREPRRRRVRPADRRRAVADRRSRAVGRPLRGAAGGLRRRDRLGEAARRRIPAALLGQRRHAARARPVARLARCEDAARARSPTRARASIRATSSARSCRRARPRTGPAGPTGTCAPASPRSSSAGCRPGATRSSLRTGDYARVA